MNAGQLIGQALYDTFGSGLLVMTFLVFFLVIALTVLRMNLAVILLVIVPLIMAVIANVAISNLLEIPTWIGLILVMMVMGFLFYLVLWMPLKQ